MAQPDGRLEQGQSVKTALSASKWNDLCDAADIVHGRSPASAGVASPGRQHLLCKTQATWAKGESQTLVVYGGPLGQETATSSSVQAHNKFTEIDADKWVVVARVSESWYVISAECS